MNKDYDKDRSLFPLETRKGLAVHTHLTLCVLPGAGAQASPGGSRGQRGRNRGKKTETETERERVGASATGGGEVFLSGVLQVQSLNKNANRMLPFSKYYHFYSLIN